MADVSARPLFFTVDNNGLGLEAWCLCFRLMEPSFILLLKLKHDWSMHVFEPSSEWEVGERRKCTPVVEEISPEVEVTCRRMEEEERVKEVVETCKRMVGEEMEKVEVGRCSGMVEEEMATVVVEMCSGRAVLALVP